MRWTNRLLGPPGTRHFIDHGTVGCPVRGKDVDLDTCTMCAALDSVEREGDDTVLYCSPVARRHDTIRF